MITTKEWKEAGLPFELWLRYSQSNATTQKAVEEAYRKREEEMRGEENGNNS